LTGGSLHGHDGHLVPPVTPEEAEAAVPDFAPEV
jgi:hypothetical protein